MRRLLFLAFLPLVLSACGGDATALDPVAEAATKTRDVATARFTISGAFNESGERTAFTGTGALVDRGDTITMKMHVPPTGGDEAFDAEIVMPPGNTIYLRTAAFRDSMPAGKRWVAFKDGDPNVDIGQNDPTQWLDFLRAVGDVREVGTEDVRGRPTTHFKASMQLDRVNERVPAEKRAQLQPAFDAMKRIGLKSIPLDVWVGDDGYVHRLALNWNVRNPKDAKDFLKLRVRMDLFDFGAAIQAERPSPAETITFEQLMRRVEQGG